MRKKLLALFLVMAMAGTQSVGSFIGTEGLSRVYADEDDGDTQDDGDADQGDEDDQDGDSWDDENEDIEEWADGEGDEEDDGQTGQKEKETSKEELPEGVTKDDIVNTWEKLREYYNDSDDGDKWEKLLGDSYGADGDDDKRDWAIENRSSLLYESLEDSDEQQFYNDLCIISELFMYRPDRFSYSNIVGLINALEEPEQPIEDPQPNHNNNLFPVLIPEDISNDDANKIFDKFYYDNTQFYFLDFASTTYKLYEGDTYDYLAPSVYPAFMTGGVDEPEGVAGVTLSDFAGVKEKVESAVEEVENDSRYADGGKWKKVQCVHDWLVNEVDYYQFAGCYVPVSVMQNSNYNTFVNENYLDPDEQTVEKEGQTCCNADRHLTFDQSAYSVFGRTVGEDYPIFYSDSPLPKEPRYEANRINTITKKQVNRYTVCAGYSKAFAYLVNRMGISGVTASAMAGNGHEWSVVNIDGDNYNIDVTWDDEGGKNYDFPVEISYEYFARDDKFFKDGHDKEKQYDGERWLPCDIDVKPHTHSYVDFTKNGDFKVCVGDFTAKLFYEVDQDADGNHVLKQNNGAYVYHQMTDELKDYTEVIADMPGTDSHKDPVFTTVKELSKTIAASSSNSQTSSSTAQTSTVSSTTTSSTGYVSSSDSSGSSGGGSGNVSFSNGGSVAKGKGASAGVFTKTGKQSVSYNTSPKNMNAKKLKIPATVKIGKKTYKVTKIEANAFTGFDKLKSLTIGKEMRKISPDAFNGCKNLKIITLKSTHLKAKNIKNAFRNSSIRTVNVPAAKVYSYKKIFTKKNTASTKKITLKAIKE